MTEHNFEAMRQAMVDSQLRTTAVSDPRVVAAMGAVPREQFVPTERRALAYVDIAVPLDNGRALSAPMVVGRLLTEAQIEANDRVLLIAAGTGYTAAVLAQLTALVVAVEDDDALFSRAESSLGIGTSVTLVRGPLTDGCAAHAPYNVVVIDGAVEFVPDAIIGQMKEGARIVTGLIDSGVTRLVRGVRVGGVIGFTSFADADVPVLPAFVGAKTFSF